MSKITNQYTVLQEPAVYRKDREEMNGHKSVVVWFTGLSGSGKSTLAYALEKTLHENKVRTFVLDGDNIRQGLCNDLGFSDNDRVENIRRIGEVSKLMMNAGSIVITAFISPFINDCVVESIFDSQDDTKYYKKKSYFIGNQWSLLDNKIGASFRYVDSKNFDDNYVYSISYMIKNYQPYDVRLNYSKGFSSF